MRGVGGCDYHWGRQHIDELARTRRRQDREHVTGTAEGESSRPSDALPQPGTVESTAQSRFAVPGEAVLALLGSRDKNLQIAEELLDADIHVRGNEVTLSGSPGDVAFAERVFTELVTLASRSQHIGPDTVRRTVAMLSAGTVESPAEVLSLDILSRRGRTIRPKTLNQKRYVDAIDAHTVVFCIGPAGTGKTRRRSTKTRRPQSPRRRRN